MHKIIAASDHFYTADAMDIVRDEVAMICTYQNVSYTAAIAWLQSSYRDAAVMYGLHADSLSRQIVGALGALHREHEANKAAARDFICCQQVGTRDCCNFHMV